MIMQVAIGIHGSDIDKVIVSEHYFTHSSPTLFTAWKSVMATETAPLFIATCREYDGFVNPRRLRARVGWGMGVGWQNTTHEKPHLW